MNARITLPQAIALYVAAILGSGILFVSSGAATVAGPASLLSWFIMVLFSFPLAYTFASLSRAHPDAGGAATFVRMAFGEHPGNLVGWFYFLTASVGQMIVALTGAYYMASTEIIPIIVAGVAMSIVALLTERMFKDLIERNKASRDEQQRSQAIVRELQQTHRYG